MTEPASDNSITVDIYDQTYNLRGQDTEYIRRLAEMVDGKMRAVAAHGKTVDSLRVAVLAALNIADEYHLLKRRLEKQMEKPSPEARQRPMPEIAVDVRL
jgi:cell division protein ZapA